ncbi:MAG TPA: ATP-binding protein [Cellvibrionaceae bacterium]
MKLRQQLALVSLVALLLPWALVEYLAVFGQVIKDGQLRALEATAQAVAARLGSDPALMPLHSIDYEHSLYVHPLPFAPTLDGYADEWRNLDVEPRLFSDESGFSVAVRTGRHRGTLSLMLDVKSLNVSFHRPGSEKLASADHLVIAIGHNYFILRASAPGSMQTVHRTLSGQVQSDYRIRGVLQQTAEGYSVEIQLPISLARESFALAVIDDNRGQPRALGTLGSLALRAGGTDPGILPATHGRLIEPSDSVQQALDIFARAGHTLTVTDAQLWQLARSQQPPETGAQSPHWLWQAVLNRIGSRHSLPTYEPQHTGRHNNPITRRAISGQSHGQWLQSPGGERAVVSAPIYREQTEALENQLAGVVIVEQTSNPWQHLNAQAIKRLLLITLASGLVLLLVLIGYASWLSWRIGRLNRAARKAQQQVTPEALLAAWPQSRINDELTDLSENYRALLQQVRLYTDYLKTLSSKLSHELRTPLAVVRSSLDNLAGLNLPTEAHTYTQRARDGAGRLSDILSAMTEASRVEASIVAAEKETIHLARLLKDICQAYTDTYQRPVILSADTPDSDIWQTQLAPELLVQMLDKLIDNANDFAPAGTPIELSLNYLADTENPHCLISVSNTGPALPPALAGQLFNSLTTGRPQFTADSRIHLGLGLFIVSLIADYHGGTARARNRPDGTGVIFDIDMPLPPPAVFAPKRV